MSASPVDHYRAMGLGPGATSEEVRHAYLRLARNLHPDRFMDASDTERSLAERRMREVNAAWEVLGRPDRRRDYDRGRATPKGRTGAPRRPPRAGPTAPPVAPTGPGSPLAEEPDDVELSRPVAFLLRRGPIVVFLAVALGLFVGTALAGSGRGDDDPSTAPSTSAVCADPGGC